MSSRSLSLAFLRKCNVGILGVASCAVLMQPARASIITNAQTQIYVGPTSVCTNSQTDGPSASSMCNEPTLFVTATASASGDGLSSATLAVDSNVTALSSNTMFGGVVSSSVTVEDTYSFLVLGGSGSGTLGVHYRLTGNAIDDFQIPTSTAQFGVDAMSCPQQLFYAELCQGPSVQPFIDVTIPVPFTFGTPTLFIFDFTASASDGVGGPYGQPGSLVSNASGTAQFTGFDVNGTPVSTGGPLQVQVLPEPSTWTVAVLGLAFIIVRRASHEHILMAKRLASSSSSLIPPNAHFRAS